MNLTLETHQLSLPRKTRGAVSVLVNRVFRKLGNRVARIRMTLRRDTGSRPGNDRVCMISAELSDGGTVVVVDRGDSMRGAILSGLRRSKQRVVSELRRRGQKRRLRADCPPQPLAA